MASELIIAAKRLRAFLERIERLEEERKTLADDIADVYKELVSDGFDKDATKIILKIRKADDGLAIYTNKTGIVDTYMVALGMVPEIEPDRAPARTRENIEQFDAETGEIIEPTSPQSTDVVNPVAQAKPAPAESKGGTISAPQSSSPPASSPRPVAKPEADAPPVVASGTLSPAAFPQAVAPEPTPVPTNGSGALIQPDPHLSAGETAAGAYQALLPAGAKSEGVPSVLVGQVGDNAVSQSRQAGQAVAHHTPDFVPAFLARAS